MLGEKRGQYPRSPSMVISLLYPMVVTKSAIVSIASHFSSAEGSPQLEIPS